MPGEPPKEYIDLYFLERRRIVEALLKAKGMDEISDLIYKNSLLLAPTVATCGPAGVNAAPFMLSFMVKEEYLEEAIGKMKTIIDEMYGKGWRAMLEAAKFLLDYVYNLERSDPLTLVSHLMSKGHTYRNLVDNGRATISILIPPDRGAFELRTRVEIVEDGLVYEYANLLHDMIHVAPEGERSHPWYPALVFHVEEIYDNSFQKLGVKIYP
ncbi:MAG: pyridoxamine 5'-phosphate oxidase family protein [Desulfurococcales archaeon]|nr:pyridoxamine 5'-phosphate oxidase family protein [Desulfurococcales archaeon]